MARDVSDDKEYYPEYDGPTGMYVVLRVDTDGHAYSSWMCEEDAQQAADRMNGEE